MAMQIAAPVALMGLPETAWKASASPVRAKATSAVPGKVTARLLAELQGAQQASEVECRLLTGVADLFAELADEERRRRSSWEERTERTMRDLRATVDADLAKGACESRRLLAETRREAQEASRLARACHELMPANQPGEEPGAGLARFVSREAQNAARAEAERTFETLRAYVAEDPAGILQQAMREEGGRWAEACASQIADGLLREQQARELCKTSLECRMSQTEEFVARCREEVEKTCADSERRIGIHLQELDGAWTAAWKDEAQARVMADCETVQRLEALTHACESTQSVKSREISQPMPANQPNDTAIAELRSHVEDAFACLRDAGVETHGQLRNEVEERGTADARLAASVEQLRALVSKVVALLEDQHSSDTLNGLSGAVPKPKSPLSSSIGSEERGGRSASSAVVTANDAASANGQVSNGSAPPSLPVSTHGSPLTLTRLTH